MIYNYYNIITIMPRDLFGSRFGNRLGYSPKDDYLGGMNYRMYGDDEDDYFNDKFSYYQEMLHHTTRGRSMEEELDRYGIRNYTIQGNVVNVKGNVNLSRLGLEKIPFVFGKVTGDFKCTNNRLTRLLGCPDEVGGDFDCSNNMLTTLQFGPKRVAMDYVCEHNQLEYLHLGNVVIEGDLFASGNRISTFKHLPQELGGMLYPGSLFDPKLYVTNSPHIYKANSNNLVHISEMPESFLHPLFASHIDIEHVKMDCDLIALKRQWTLNNIINEKD